MAYPADITTISRPAATDTMADSGVEGDVVIGGIADVVEALEAKVGIDSSTVSASIDYKLSTITTGDKAVSLTGTETLTNKTFTSPTITTPTITNPVITGLTADTLDEASVNSGVTVENVLIKDGEVTTDNNLAYKGTDSGATTRNVAKIDSANNLILGDSGLTGSWQLQPRSFTSVTVSGTQSITTATFTKIQLNTENYDLNDEWDVATYTFTAALEGLYRITSQFNYTDTAAAAANVYLSIYKNGVEVKRSNTPAAASYENIFITSTLQLNANDTISFYTYQDSGVSKTLNNNSLANFAEVLKVA